MFEKFRLFERGAIKRPPVTEALNTFLAEDLISSENLPPAPRATMDGYAVRAKDTFGARENEPVVLELVGEIKMGEAPLLSLNPGQTVRIATGGFLPPGADAVVMLEHAEENQNLVEIKRPAAPHQHTLLPGEDFSEGALVFKAGQRITPAVAGVLAGLGFTEVPVRERPKVGIISTGDELVPPEEKPPLGKIRDINSYSLYAATQEAGGIPTLYGIVPDDQTALSTAVEKALAENQVVLISGGSSVGTRDYTLEIIKNLPESELLCHGLAVRPGKPTILAKVKNKALFGLPGQVASALLIFYVLVRPFLLYLQGAEGEGLLLKRIWAKASRNIPSVAGREDFVRVKITSSPEGPIANPIFKKSGLISSMAEADGFLRIPEEAEGIYQGEWAEIYLLP